MFPITSTFVLIFFLQQGAQGVVVSVSLNSLSALTLTQFNQNVLNL